MVVEEGEEEEGDGGDGVVDWALFLEDECGFYGEEECED